MYRDPARIALSPSDFMASAIKQGEELGFSRSSLLHAITSLGEDSSTRESVVWPVWMTLKIGGMSSEELLKLLKKNGFHVSDWAKDIMAKPAFTTKETHQEVQLVRLKVKDLGFASEPTTNELFARAKERGLDLCPAEVGPHLRLALTDQPRDEWFWVAMEPISDSNGYPNVFGVERNDDGKQWLFADYANPDYRWDLEDGVVFCLRK